MLMNACYHSDQSLLSSRLLSRNVKVKIYKAIILPFVLYGCETWSLTLRQGHGLRVFGNRVLRRIFGSKGDEETVEWRKLNNEEIYNLYSSPDIIWQLKSSQVKANEVGGASVQGFGGKAEGKRPLGRPRGWWEVGIRWVVGKLACGCGLDSTGSGQEPAAGRCECGDEPSGSCATELVLVVITLIRSYLLNPKIHFSNCILLLLLYLLIFTIN
jgi:hypothetical protein